MKNTEALELLKEYEKYEGCTVKLKGDNEFFNIEIVAVLPINIIGTDNLPQDWLDNYEEYALNNPELDYTIYFIEEIDDEEIASLCLEEWNNKFEKVI